MNSDKNLTRREESTPERIQQRHTVTPPVDIYESDTEILLMADIPGVGTDNLKINLEGGELLIEGCRSQDLKGVLLAEMYEVCDYSRAFKVPNTIDATRIDAELKDGVLTVHLPKVAAVQPRRISVKAG